MAKGVASRNLFDGLAEYGSLSYTTGAEDVNANVIRNTNPIQVAKGGAITVTTFSGQLYDVCYVFEYNGAGTFIRYQTMGAVGTKVFTLDSNTEYIRFRSQTNGSGYVLPSLDWYATGVQIEEGANSTAWTSNYPELHGTAIAEHSIPKTKMADDLATYYTTGKDRVVDKVYTNITSPNNAVFGLIADIQGSTSDEIVKNILENYTNINYLCKEVPASFIANLGDFISGYSTKATTVAELRKYAKTTFSASPIPYFVAKGNHDDNSYWAMNNGSLYADIIGPDEWYKYVIKYSERWPQFNFDTANRSGGYCYYDDDVSKIRFIFLNTADIPLLPGTGDTYLYDAMHNPAFRDAQLQWLAHTALNFTAKSVPGDWAVSIFVHDILALQKITPYFWVSLAPFSLAIAIPALHQIQILPAQYQ